MIFEIECEIGRGFFRFFAGCGELLFFFLSGSRDSGVDFVDVVLLISAFGVAVGFREVEFRLFGFIGEFVTFRYWDFMYL